MRPVSGHCGEAGEVGFTVGVSTVGSYNRRHDLTARRGRLKAEHQDQLSVISGESEDD